MTDLERVSKLIGKIHILIHLLEQHNDLTIHQRISQSYYMQKSAELLLMQDQLLSSLRKKESFETMLTTCYAEVGKNWQQDIRWLKRQLRERKKTHVL